VAWPQSLSTQGCNDWASSHGQLLSIFEGVDMFNHETDTIRRPIVRTINTYTGSIYATDHLRP
jgi:hypothetical protein